MALSLFVRFNNQLTRIRRVRVRPENLLLLVPRCIQQSACSRSLGATLDECTMCGKCHVRELRLIQQEFGIRCSLAAGGREALVYVRDPQVKAVVAVACEKELFQGICAVFPTPVLGVLNISGDLPCRNTGLDPDSVREAVRALLV